MKCLLINLIVFVIVVDSDTSKRLFLPQLPIGEYRIKFLGILRCSSNNKIQFNYYLSKTSTNTTEFKGNITYLEPFDDSLSIELNLAVKDSIGGWKDNAHIFKSPKACSSMKNYLGNSWNSIMEHLGFHNASCPIPVGCYVTRDFHNIDDHNFNLPKTFFYGTYKVRIQITKKNVVYGCYIPVVEVKRPWESD